MLPECRKEHFREPKFLNFPGIVLSDSPGLVEWFSGLASLDHRLPDGQAGRQAIFFYGKFRNKCGANSSWGKVKQYKFFLNCWNEQCNATMSMTMTMVSQNMDCGSISAVLWPFSFGILVYVQILIQSLLLLQQAFVKSSVSIQVL